MLSSFEKSNFITYLTAWKFHPSPSAIKLLVCYSAYQLAHSRSIFNQLYAQLIVLPGSCIGGFLLSLDTQLYLKSDITDPCQISKFIHRSVCELSEALVKNCSHIISIIHHGGDRLNRKIKN